MTSRLRANLFEKEGAASAFLPVLPYLPMSTDGSDSLKYESRDSKSRGRGGYSYSGGYGADMPPVDAYGGYGSLQVKSVVILFLLIRKCSLILLFCFSVN